MNRIEKEALDVLSKVQSLVVDEQPPADIAGKRLDEKQDPRDDGVSVAKSKL